MDAKRRGGTSDDDTQHETFNAARMSLIRMAIDLPYLRGRSANFNRTSSPPLGVCSQPGGPALSVKRSDGPVVARIAWAATCVYQAV